MIEKILFAIIAFILFIIMFLKMIQKNDTNYIYVLSVQALGIIIQFIGMLFNFKIPTILLLLCYMCSIVIPILIFIIEKKGLNFSELICFIYTTISKDDDKNKKMVMQLIEKYPNSYYAHKMLAEIYEKEENYSIAAEEYMRALDGNTKDYNLYYKIANSLNEIDKKDEAIKTLNELLKGNPEHYEASLLLIDILYEKENFKEAVTVCVNAMKYKPGDYELYYNLGMLYTRLNDFQSAKEYYEKAAELNSVVHNVKYNLGQIALIYNELEEAEEYFMECINADCMEEGSYYYLAYIEMLKGEKEKAINYLNIAVEENKKYYEKAKKEIVFKLIINRINKPTNEKEIRNKLKAKEEQTILHLENTYDLVGSLNNNDIKVIKTIQKEKEHELE